MYASGNGVSVGGSSHKFLVPATEKIRCCVVSSVLRIMTWDFWSRSLVKWSSILVSVSFNGLRDPFRNSQLAGHGVQRL